MLDLLIYILFTSSPPQITQIDICKENTDHLTYQNRITFYIGCSEVNGNRVYTQHVLRRLLDGRSYSY